MIGFILYNLARNPDIQETLYKEIHFHAPLNKPLSINAINKMKYLKACIKESYRYVQMMNVQFLEFMFYIVYTDLFIVFQK